MKELEQTLAEQLKITPQEIAKRKEMLAITQADEEILRNNKMLFKKYLDGSVKSFYDQLKNIPQAARLVGDVETARRLHFALSKYVLELFGGNYDDIYVNQRLRIGKVHQRMGVDTTLYLAAMHWLETSLIKTVNMTYFRQEDSLTANNLKVAINKILMFDSQLVLGTYIASLVDEVNIAKDEVSQYAHNLEIEVARRTRQLEELSLKDGLTELYNQRAFYDHLRRELSSAERYKESLSLCYLDLNGFKQLNDSLGHQSGDELLTLMGSTMLEVTRDSDIACRYGGDEFCMILPKTNIDEAAIVASRLIELFNKAENRGVRLSIGVSCTGTETYPDVDKLIKQADTLMYKSKAASKKKQGNYITTDTEATKPA